MVEDELFEMKIIEGENPYSPLSFTLLFIGNSGVGKSSLLINVQNQIFQTEQITTLFLG